MIFTQHYESPLGGILLAADDIGLTGLWFEGQKYFARTLDAVHQEQETAVLSEARRGLYPAAPSRWLCLSAGGVGAAAPHPLRPDHDLWGTGKAAGCRARPFPDVCAGCGRGCRSQCDLHHHSLPPRCRNKRQPDRICRRHREKSRAAETGNENDAVRNTANKKIRTFSRWEEVRIFLVWWRRWESNQFPPFYREKSQFSG